MSRVQREAGVNGGSQDPVHPTARPYYAVQVDYDHQVEVLRLAADLACGELPLDGTRGRWTLRLGKEPPSRPFKTAHETLAPSWHERFGSLRLARKDAGTTLLVGPLPDWAALQGVLWQIVWVGLTLLSLETCQAPGGEEAAQGS
jgi:hypothetical protein